MSPYLSETLDRHFDKVEPRSHVTSSTLDLCSHVPRAIVALKYDKYIC